VIYTSIHYASAKLTHRAAIFNNKFWPREDWPDPTLLGQIDFDWGYLGDDLGPGGEIANNLVFMGGIVPEPAAVMLLLQSLSFWSGIGARTCAKLRSALKLQLSARSPDRWRDAKCVSVRGTASWRSLELLAWKGRHGNRVK
jgi:hypothetical protein